ncbi:CTD phosphatase Fcp1 [Basidiobolus ranarum]|uniref:RNA polymerase II subunit A C-terminal domain phosphatase n=1 Tax=Basidiobolus ranarum TaxID=34480 RepID=A0ABR2WU92_9FUNG
METVHGIFIPEEHLPATIISFKVSSKEEIRKYQPVCLYEYITTEEEITTPNPNDPDQEPEVKVVVKNTRKELSSPFEGTISTILTTVGEKITEKSRSILNIKEPCNHGAQLNDLSVYNAKDLSILDFQDSDFNGVGVNITPDAYGPKEAEDLEYEASDRLLQSRKLSLIVDLDQTIIHTTIDPIVGDWMNDEKSINSMAINEISTFTLPDSPTVYYIKLRPGLREFLKEATELYELHIYTMGTRAYASAVADAIDPEQEFFKERIYSRDESEDMTPKTIQRLFSCSSSMVVAIDDSEDIWQLSPNLIRVNPYKFFVGTDGINESSLLKQGAIAVTESKQEEDLEDRENNKLLEQPQQVPRQIETKPVLIDNDTQLPILLQVLKDIHHSFYSEHKTITDNGVKQSNPPDVKNIIASMKSRVLKHTNIVFSSIIPFDCDPTKSEIWRLARSFGAECSTNLNNQITHVVASKPGTAKVNHACKIPHVHIVKPEWLFDSISRWERQDEKLYLIQDTSPAQTVVNSNMKLNRNDRGFVDKPSTIGTNEAEEEPTLLDLNEMNEHMMHMDWSDAAREVEDFLGDSDFNTATSEVESERDDDDRFTYRKRKFGDFLNPENMRSVNSEESEKNRTKRMCALRTHTSPLKNSVIFMEGDIFETQSDALVECQSGESDGNHFSEYSEIKGDDDQEDESDFLNDFSREIEEELNRPETPAPTI